MRGFDFSSLRPPIIAINKAYQHIPQANHLYFTDAPFWEAHQAGLLVHGGVIHTGSENVSHPSVVCWKGERRGGLSFEPNTLRIGNNSGYAAINLAVQLGYSHLILLGYDLGPTDGQTHFHEGYAQPTSDIAFRKMREYFQLIAGPLSRAGITVVNGSPESSLTFWPRMTPEKALCSR